MSAKELKKRGFKFFKLLVTHNIDAVALLGQAANELSLLRREQIKPTLKPEYYPICNTDIPNSQLLFGDDLAKRVRDAQDTSKLANKLGSTAKTQPRTGSRYGHFNKSDKMRDNSRPFLGRGQRPSTGKNNKTGLRRTKTRSVSRACKN